VNMRIVNKFIFGILFFFAYIVNVEASSLDDGNYIVTSALNSDKVVDLTNASVKNGANIQLYSLNETSAQKWKFQKDKDGYYTISTNKNDQYVLDVSDAKFVNCSNVQLYKRNGTNAQKWKLQKDKDGYYTIVSYNERYALDVNGANILDGTNIQIYINNGTKAQKFAINKVVKKEKTLHNGIYSISSFDTQYYLSISGSPRDTANIHLEVENDSKSQKWYVEYLSNGYYSIRSFIDYLFSLDVANGSKVENTNIWLYRYYNLANSQQWIIKDTGSGYYSIISKGGLYLDTEDQEGHDGNNILLNLESGLNSQKFKFTKIDTFGDNTISDGNYIITSKLHNSKVIDLNAALVQNSSNIQIYDYNASNAQKWYFKRGQDGYYTISSSSNQNYVLDVSGASFEDNSNVQLYKSNNTKAQKWQLLEDKDGYYTIVSYDERYVLDLTGANTINGGNIQLYRYNQSNAQKFAIHPVVMSGIRTLQDGIYTIENYGNDYALDITNREIINGSNINIQQKNNTDSQKWYVKYLDNGYYSITSFINTKYSLDVDGGLKVKNTNIQLYSGNNTPAQQWLIKEFNDNNRKYYTIVSKTNGLQVDIADQNLVNGANVLCNVASNSDTQKFIFTKVEVFGTQTIADGYYFINSKLNSLKSVDVHMGAMTENTNVQLFDSNSYVAQKWHIKYIGDGYYSILCDGNSTYGLTSAEETTSNVRINTYSGLPTQKWIIKANNNGTYSILTKDYLFLDVVGSSTVNGTNIQIYPHNNSNAQQFFLIPTAQGNSQKVIENGYYFINSAVDTNYVLDVALATDKNGSNVQAYSLNYSKAQKWYVEYIGGSGYYRITSSLPAHRALDVSGASTKEGTNVQLYGSNSSYAQQWIVKDTGDGSFYIISNCNGLYLDLDNNNILDGVNIETNTFTGNASQKFKFTKTRLENLVLDISAWQEDIDWKQVKNSGIYGVILRISAGCDYEDVKFAQNIKKVKELGIPYGIYIFSYAENYHEGVLHAQFTQFMITKYGLNPTLGIYLDLEDSGFGMTEWMGTHEYTEVVQGYMSVIPHAKIYCNLNFANGKLNTPYLRSYISWIAQWGPQCTYSGYYKMWQYSNDGYIPGIPTRVDLNYYYFD